LVIVQYKIRKIRESKVVLLQLPSSEAQKGKKKEAALLFLHLIVVSCCAQQLFELIQQFRIIEKFRENEAVLLLNCGLGSTKRLPVFAFNVSCCAQQLFELIKHLRTPIEQIKMKGGAHFKLQR
jgi:hypothetical protein